MKRFRIPISDDRCPTCGAARSVEWISIAYPEDVAASPSAGIRSAYRRGYLAARTGSAREAGYPARGFGHGLRIAFFRGFDDAKLARPAKRSTEVRS